MFTRFLPLFALLLALPLAACATDEAEVADDDVDVAVVDDATPADDMGDDMADDAVVADEAVTAQGTLDAVTAAGGLTQLPAEAAVDNIDAWIAQLTGVEGAEAVVAGLETLKGQLTADELDGAAIGGTLSELGAGTTAAAGDDTALQQLGQALSDAGASLTAGDA